MRLTAIWIISRPSVLWRVLFTLPLFHLDDPLAAYRRQRRPQANFSCNHCKNGKLYNHGAPTSQTDRRTTCRSKYRAMRAVKRLRVSSCHLSLPPVVKLLCHRWLRWDIWSLSQTLDKFHTVIKHSITLWNRTVCFYSQPKYWTKVAYNKTVF